MSPMPKIHDLDADLGLDVPAKPTKTKQVRLFGRVWDVRCDINSFAISAIASGDVKVLSGYMRNAVVPEQSEDFIAALLAIENLDGEKLSSIINALVEVQAERPTKQPSDFARPAKPQASRPKSTARSSAMVRRAPSRS